MRRMQPPRRAVQLYASDAQQLCPHRRTSRGRRLDSIRRPWRTCAPSSSDLAGGAISTNLGRYAFASESARTVAAAPMECAMMPAMSPRVSTKCLTAAAKPAMVVNLPEEAPCAGASNAMTECPKASSGSIKCDIVAALLSQPWHKSTGSPLPQRYPCKRTLLAVKSNFCVTAVCFQCFARATRRWGCLANQVAALPAAHGDAACTSPKRLRIRRRPAGSDAPSLLRRLHVSPGAWLR